VDDEPHVLSSIRRGLADDFEVHTAESGEAALELVAENEPFTVVVADCRMPRMNGIELLARLSRSSPDSVRMMLTGNTDQQTAVQALNTGEIFKFLNKPCDTEALRKAVSQGVRQHELITAEKELLGKTLHGSIRALGELLGIAKPEAFGRTDRIRRKAGELAAKLDGVKAWELDTAALLSQLGCVRLPAAIMAKVAEGKALTSAEQSEFIAHATLGADLIAAIPRLEYVAEVVRYQNKHYDGGGWPHDDVKGDAIPLEARILQAALAHDELSSAGWPEDKIIAHLAAHRGRIDPKLLAALTECARTSQALAERRLLPSELAPGMVLQEDVRTDNGMMLLCRGTEVTPGLRKHLTQLQETGLVTKRFLVAVSA
jgi:response regulator RpfG family c-di-GMP phosphodiesterase